MTDAAQTIAGFEGFRSTPYYDRNAWRVGYGSDTVTHADGSVTRVTPNTTVTQDEAARDLARRTAQSQQSVISSIGQDAWDNLSSEAQAAATSIAYNYGSLMHLPSLVNALQTGDPQVISSAIQARAVDNNGINSQRRAVEAALVANATPTPTSSALQAVNQLGDPQGQVDNLSSYGDPTGLLGPSGLSAVPSAAPIPLAPLSAQNIPSLNNGQTINGQDVTPNAPKPQTVTINGKTYQVGQVLSAGGNSYTVQPNGTFQRVPSLGIGTNTIAGGMVGRAVNDAIKQVPSQLSGVASSLGTQAGALGSQLGGMFGGLFGGKSSTGLSAIPAPATSAASWADPYLNANASPDPSRGLTGLGAMGGYTGTGSSDITPNQNSPFYTPPAMDVNSVQKSDGSYSIPDLSQPLFGSNAASTRSSGMLGTGAEAQSYFNGLNAMPAADLGSLGVPNYNVPKYINISKQIQVPSSLPIEQGSGVHWDAASGNYVLDAAAPAPKPTFKTVQVKVANPAYNPPVGLAAVAAPPLTTKVQQLQAGGMSAPQAYDTLASRILANGPDPYMNRGNNGGGNPGGSTLAGRA